MLLLKNRNFALLSLMAIAVLFSTVSWAAEDALPKKITSEHVALSCPGDTDVPTLTRQLNIGLSEKLLAGKSTKAKGSPEAELADSLETLFVQVSDIMDMHLYSLQVNVEVCRDADWLRTAYRKLFDDDLGNRKSFYVADATKIYISAPDFNAWILGHEMAHAIMAHYFVVPPPVKIQEVLAGYVEYSLRKMVK